MDRAIKFRAWNPYAKTMQGPASLYELASGAVCWPAQVYDHVMQFTGLIDKNGKEIFEGDVVEGAMGSITRYVVKHGLFEDIGSETDGNNSYQYGWYIKRVNIASDIAENLVSSELYLTVIGNIHENPELLEKEA